MRNRREFLFATLGTAAATALPAVPGLARFAVAGPSAGAPYCLAAARAMPDGVAPVSLGCPMAPLEAVGHRTGGGAHGVDLAERHPVLTSMVLARQVRMARRNPDK